MAFCSGFDGFDFILNAFSRFMTPSFESLAYKFAPLILKLSIKIVCFGQYKLKSFKEIFFVFIKVFPDFLSFKSIFVNVNFALLILTSIFLDISI